MFFPDQIKVARGACNQKQYHAKHKDQRPSGETIFQGIQNFKALNKVYGLGRLYVSQ